MVLHRFRGTIAPPKTKRAGTRSAGYFGSFRYFFFGVFFVAFFFPPPP
jgi:hypothetical protein